MMPRRWVPSPSASSPVLDTASGVACGNATADDSGLSGRTE
jgi:hypothetical protein